MNLLAEWSARRKHRTAVPGSEPAKQDSPDHTALLATTIIPIGTIGTNGTGISAETDPETPPKLPQDLGPDAELHVSVDDLVADLKAVFMGNGPASEAAAERLAESTNGTSGPAGAALPAWQSWMKRRFTVWRKRGFSRAEALGIVWGEAEAEWHKRHGAVPDPTRCAGCGERLPSRAGMQMLDGAVVHIGDPEQVECLAIYGAQWRGAASSGLMALGLMRPRP